MKTIFYYLACFVFWVKGLFSHNKPVDKNAENKDVIDFVDKKLSEMNHEDGYNWVKSEK